MNQIRWLCIELYNYTHDIYCIMVTCKLSEPQNCYHRNCYRTVAQVKMIWDEELIQISLGHILSLSEQRAFLIENCVVIVNFSHFCLLQNHWIKFNQTQHKALLGKGDLSLFKWMGTPFPSGDDNQIVIIHWWNWKIFFFRTTGQISTKLGRKHSWEKGIQVFANKGLFSFSNRTLNQCYGIIKPLCRYVYWLELFLRWVMWPLGLLFTNSYSLKFKIFFSRTLQPISTKLGTKYPCVNSPVKLAKWSPPQNGVFLPHNAMQQQAGKNNSSWILMQIILKK